MILSIDIGGTAVKMALMDRDGHIHTQTQSSVNFDDYHTPIIKTVLQVATAFLKAHGTDIEGIGVSATGQIDTMLGTVVGTNGHIPGYEGTAIKAELEASFHVPVWVLNDANAAVLGECFLGVGRGYSEVLMITLGTGVGGGLVVNGGVYGGSRGLAGELGHFALYNKGLTCSCGNRGCFECYASASALARRAGASSAKAVFDSVRAGNRAMKEALDDWIDDIAYGLIGLVHLLNPQLVLIGGGVSVQEELLMNPLREKVLSGVMPRFSQDLRVQSAKLGNDAGMIGALRFWLEQQKMSTKNPPK